MATPGGISQAITAAGENADDIHPIILKPCFLHRNIWLNMLPYINRHV